MRAVILLLSFLWVPFAFGARATHGVQKLTLSDLTPINGILFPMTQAGIFPDPFAQTFQGLGGHITALLQASKFQATDQSYASDHKVFVGLDEVETDFGQYGLHLEANPKKGRSHVLDVTCSYNPESQQIAKVQFVHQEQSKGRFSNFHTTYTLSISFSEIRAKAEATTISCCRKPQQVVIEKLYRPKNLKKIPIGIRRGQPVGDYVILDPKDKTIAFIDGMAQKVLEMLAKAG